MKPAHTFLPSAIQSIRTQPAKLPGRISSIMDPVVPGLGLHSMPSETHAAVVDFLTRSRRLFFHRRTASSFLTGTLVRPLLILVTGLGHLQTASAQSLQNPSNTVFEPVSASSIKLMDANKNIWQSVTSQTNTPGTVVNKTNFYSELATGLNHLVNGQWVASSENLAITGTGAAATNGQHQAYFTGNLNTTGAIHLVTSDGQDMRSHIMGLGYYDASNGLNVLFSQVQDSTGQILPSWNQALYTNAFTDVEADVRYTYTKAGLEQDIILRTQPPDPRQWNMNPQTTRLQIWTEFDQTPVPQRDSFTNELTGEVEDDILSLGAMQIGQGKAFSLQDGSSLTPVIKHWVTYSNPDRIFLVEEVPLNAIAQQLANLPAISTATNGTNFGSPGASESNGRSIKGKVSDHPLLFARKTDQHPAARIPMRVASKASDAKGFVMDYSILSSATNFTFQSDTTYYVSGPVTLTGATIEGGTVIKFTNQANATIAMTSFTNKTAPYRPAVFTSKDDNSVGSVILGSTGSPSRETTSFLQYSPARFVTPTPLKNMRFKFAGVAVTIPTFSSEPDMWDIQFVNCGVAICDEPTQSVALQHIYNGLFSQCDVAVTNTHFFIDDNTIEVTAYNVTADQIGTFCNNADILIVSNSILTAVTNVVIPSAASSPLHNCATNATSSGIYQTMGDGNYYLADGSTNRNAGSPVSASLAADLAQKTTYPPVSYAFTTFATNLSLYPQAARDTNSNPDRGYHYDPLDYMFAGVEFSNSVLTINPGTQIGLFGTNASLSAGIIVSSGGSLMAVGLPTNLTHFAAFNTVQEQSATNWIEPFSLVLSKNYLTGTNPSVNCRFADFSVMSLDMGHVYAEYSSAPPFNFQDCQFQSGLIDLEGDQAAFTNCLFEREAVVTTSSGQSLVYRNNLAWNCSGDSGFEVYISTTNSIFQDNVFYQTAVSEDDSSTSYIAGNNAYFGTGGTFLNKTNGTDKFLTSDPGYQPGTLGNYYLPTNSILLIHTGHTNANLLGMYQYTILTNQVKETTNLVSIGYHYVALGTNGCPVDSNGDGIADYVEDANGDGLDNAGEAPWDYSFNLQPVSQYAPVGTSVPFEVAVTNASTNIVTFQWCFNGTNIAGQTNQIFILSNLQTNNAGTYTAIAYAGSGSLTSAPAVLTICTPAFNLMISNVTVYAGSGSFTNLLTGITGGCGPNTVVSFTATASDPTVVSNLTVNYTNGNTSGVLTFTPAGNVVSNTTVNVSVVLTDTIANSINGAISFFGDVTPNTYYLTDATGLSLSNSTVGSSPGPTGSFYGLAGNTNFLFNPITFFPSESSIPWWTLTNSGSFYGMDLASVDSFSVYSIGTSQSLLLGTTGILHATGFHPTVGKANYSMTAAYATGATYSYNMSIGEATTVYYVTNSFTVTVPPAASPITTVVFPTNLQNFPAPTNVSISATTSNFPGSILSVSFYSTSNLLGTATNLDTNGLFSVVWTNLPAGAYAVTAVASNNLGMTNLSNIRIFRVIASNNPPLVAITSPTNYSTFRPWSELRIIANAYSASGITNVSFFNGTNFLGADITPSIEATTTNFEITLHGVVPGYYTFTAFATDSTGVSGASLPISVIVENEPALTKGYWDPMFGNFDFDMPGDLFGLGAGFALQYDSSGNLYASQCVTTGGNEASFMIYSACSWSGPIYTRDSFTHMLLNGTNLYVSADSGVEIGIWNGTNLTQVGDGLGTQALLGCDMPEPSIVQAMHFFNGDLYAGGCFTNSGTLDSTGINTNVQRIAALVGSSTNWSVVGSSLLNGNVRAIADFNNVLYVGGDFTAAGTDTSVQYLARLVNGNWQTVGSGVNGRVCALTAQNGRLYVGGEFFIAGGTNAGLVACWDGTNWSGINLGLTNGLVPIGNGSEFCVSTNRVSAIAARGDEIYVTGHFCTAWNGGTAVNATNIARAFFNQANGTWTWSALGNGLTVSGGDPSLDAGSDILIHDLDSSGSYEVIVTGSFGVADQVLSQNLGRWIVGRSDCPTNGPTVILDFPSSAFPVTGCGVGDPDAPIFSAYAETTGSGSVTNVLFLVDNHMQLWANSSYQDDWSFFTNCDTFGLVPGPHTLQAIAYDSAGLIGSSEILNITFFISGDLGPTCNPTTYYLTSSTSPTNLVLNVLTNDFPYSSSTTGVRLVGLITNNYANPFGTEKSAGGTFVIGSSGTNLVYTSKTNSYGIDIASILVGDSTGTNSTTVSVVVRAQPQVQISQPVNGWTVNAPASFSIAGGTYDPQIAIQSIQLLVNGTPYGDPLGLNPDASGNFSIGWRTATVGTYTFVAAATDYNNNTTYSSPVSVTVQPHSGGSGGGGGSGVVPVALITAPAPATTNLGFAVNTNALIVTTGQLSVAGSAYSTNGYGIFYQLQLLDPANPFNTPINVTPGTLTTTGFHSGAVTSGSLGTIDLSTIENGAYILQLLVLDASNNTATAKVPIALDSNLKIGQLSFSEQDLILPVSGIPITITRTYSSIDQRSADFGYGWTFALNSMDVVVDEERANWQVGSDALPIDYDDDTDGDIISIRTGGGSRDVTLTLPNGRRVTYAFTPWYSANSLKAHAAWTPPPGVTATLTPLGSEIINTVPAVEWADGGDDSDYNSHDVPGWVLQTLDGTKYTITRGPANNLLFDPTGSGYPVNVQVYGPPVLTSIYQRTGDLLNISPGGISHYTTNGILTRSVAFQRDTLNRITAIYDPNNGTSGFPLIQYVYDPVQGNLTQVLKLQDATAGSYTTNTYLYTNTLAPHLITSIFTANGVQVARNYYDISGRLTQMVDANGNTNQFLYNLTGQTETVIDRLGYTNIYAYDLNGNVLAQTNALGQVTTNAYDGNNNKINQTVFLNGTPYAITASVYSPALNLPLITYNALGNSNVFTYDSYGNLTTSTDARGNTSTNYVDQTTCELFGTGDALGNLTTNYYSNGLLVSSVDAAGIITTNYYDGNQNLIGTAMLNSSGTTILSSNSFIYDLNGNRTNSTVWRHVGTTWTGATTVSVYDAQNRVIQTIDANGNTNSIAYDANGRQQSTTDALGRSTFYEYDSQGRLTTSTYPDLTTESSVYDANGNRTNSIDRLGRVTTYVYDQLNRLVTTIYPDNTSNSTIYDALGRTQFTIDARNVTNAFGYDVLGQQTSVTNGWLTAVSMVMAYAYDANGNRTNTTDALQHSTTNIYDSLNRVVETLFADGSSNSTIYDAVGRKVAQTDQDSKTTLFAYDGAGRLITVTNALNKLTRYAYDEAGNQTNQVDALNNTTTFVFDNLGRRIKRILPGTQSETFGYDAIGNLIYATNFNGVVITNQYDLLNRLTNRISAGGFQVSWTYTRDGQRRTMTDVSGTTTYIYDMRDRLATNASPEGTLYYAYDAGGNLTNLISSTGGTKIGYQYDALNRLTNVLDGSLTVVSNTAYLFDAVGNLQSIRYPNTVTNLYRYDSLNRLTNLVWTNATTGTRLASFDYTLGKAGNRLGCIDSIAGTFSWGYDATYRLQTEGVTASPLSLSGTATYGFDDVGNRTSRTSALGLGMQGFTYNANDWLTTDSYDSNGNTTLSNTATATLTYQYDVENRLTNVAGGSALSFVYNGDGMRVGKIAGTTTNYFLVDDRNPTGYAQVLEEWAVTSSSTNLSHAYTYGMSIISQRAPSTVQFFGMDGHGSVRQLLSSTGSVDETNSYDAYGILIAGPSTLSTKYLYCGEQFDSDLGMYYLRARYYQPAEGRFWTIDSNEGDQEEPTSLHKYLYCVVTPANSKDPTGHDEIDDDLNIVGSLDPVYGLFRAINSLLNGPPTHVGDILNQFFGSSSQPKLWVMGPKDHYTQIVRKWGAVKYSLNVIKANLEAHPDSWAANHTTSPNWQPAAAYAFDPHNFSHSLFHPGGTDPNTATQEFTKWKLTGTQSDALYIAAVGSFELHVTVDRIDVNAKRAKLRIWMFNEMDKRSFGRFVPLFPNSAMATQWMWWNWTEDYSW